MNYNKIGNLIANERKAKNLTQANLAKKLFISEKTISKWENGNGVPDTNILPKLCEIFNLTINELLNGERLSKEEYSNRAEEKLLEMQKNKELSDKRLMKAEIIIGFFSIIILLITLIPGAYALENGYIIQPIIMIILGLLLFVLGIFFCLYIEQVAGFYVCKKCNHKYVPKFKQVNQAMHIGRTRYMKCPKCGKYSWNKKVFK